MPTRIRILAALLLACALSPAFAQLASGQPPAQAPAKSLPGMTVTADAYTESRGGYLISGDFRTDPRLPGTVFPASALVEGDVLSVETQHLNDNDYVVLQECANDDCSSARIVRVWTASSNHALSGGSDKRIIIPHENKYWIWAKQLPSIGRPDCDTCSAYFTSFERYSPPMSIRPNGEEARYHRAELDTLDERPPLAVAKEVHEGSTYVVTFVGGSTVRIRRMHAAAP